MSLRLMKSILVAATASLVSLSAFAESDIKIMVQDTTFDGPDYLLEYPKKWDELSRGAIVGVDRLIRSPLEDESDRIQENLNVALETIPADMDERAYLEDTVSLMQEYLDVTVTQKFTPVSVGKEKGHHMQFTMSQPPFDFDNDLYVVMKDKSAYIITVSYEKGKRAKFEKEMQGIIDSFDIKN